MNKKEKNIEAYEKEIMNISNKEQEILETYNEDIIEFNENTNYENEEFDYKEDLIENVNSTKKENTKKNKMKKINKKESTTVEPVSNVEKVEIITEENDEENYSSEEIKEKKQINYKKIINISFTIIVVALTMIAIDVISVARYDKGPYFAIPLKENEDGFIKEYFGIGYKVIKYNQNLGRVGKEIGTYWLKPNDKAIEFEDIDLAIAFTENEEETYKKYYNKYVRIESKIQSIDLETNSIKIGYQDEDGKYTLDIICYMAASQEDLMMLNVNDKIYVIGTIRDYEFKGENSNKKLILSTCFPM